MYAQSSDNDRYAQKIKRTICIGLGGTGRDVLMRIRRLIVDQYGKLSNLPIVSFVHIDTDKDATQTVTLRTGNIYQGVDLRFQDAEQVTATMTSTEVNSLVEGLKRFHSNQDNPYSNQDNPYNHIALWFPPQLLQNIKAIDQGAKGIRPVGRLAFFHNYLKIKKAIEVAEQRTRGHEETLLKNFDLDVDPGLNIFVVGSLCGGTGSGTFLDMAYSLKSAYPGVQIIGYLVISPELYGNTPNMCANTYAALMELDYYSRPGTHFEACYDQKYLTYVQEKRPPFDYAYLVSNETEQGKYSIDKQRKLCNVIAHKIVLDFSGELAPVIKGMRDNFAQHMLQEDDHPRPNSQWYLTFGLAAIYFPRDRISQITVVRINLDLVSFWLQGEGQSPDPQKLLDQFLIENRWHTDSNPKSGLIARLEATDIESGKTFSVLMSAWRNKLESAIAECKTKDDRSNLMRQLQRDFKEQFHKNKFGETDSSRGAWLTKLIKNRKAVLAQLRQQVDDFLSSLLTPSHQYFSVANARNWLDALQTALNGYQYDLEERVRELNSPRTLEELEKTWKNIERTLQDIESEFQIPVFSNKNTRVQDEARKAIKATDDAIKHNFDFVTAIEALEILKELQKHAQIQANQLNSLRNIVNETKSYYEKYQDTLRQSNSDEMSGEEIFPDEYIQACYNDLLPEKELHAQLVQITQEILEPAGQGQAIPSFSNYNCTTSRQIQQEIDLTVNRLLGSRSADIVQSAIKQFIQKYPPLNLPARLEQVLREAEPLLPLNTSDPYFHNNPAKRSKLIGFKDTDELEIKQFHTFLNRNLGIPDNVLKPTQAEDKVVIVTEYAGFPLRLISNLEQLKNHYHRERYHFDNALLHNECHKFFTDLIPNVVVMQKLQDIFYPCLAFDLIRQNPNTKELEFQCYDELRGNYYMACLSPVWNEALEQLMNSADMTTALEALRDKTIAEIERQPTKWEGYYLPKLRQFVEQVDKLPEDSINYFYRSRVIGARGTAETPAKEGVVNRFLKQMQERVRVLPTLSNALSATPATVESQNLLTAEIVLDSVNSGDNRTKRRIELEQLKEDLEFGVFTQEEYEEERQKILNKYPLR